MLFVREARVPESGSLEQVRRAKSAAVGAGESAASVPTLARAREAIEAWESGRSKRQMQLRMDLEQHRAGAGAMCALSLGLVWGIGASAVLGWPLWLAGLAFLGSALGIAALWVILLAVFASSKDAEGGATAAIPWWVTSALQAGAAWLITHDARFTAIVGVLALVMTAFVWPRGKGRAAGDARLPLGLPEAALPLVREIPEGLPAPIAEAVDGALRDYAHVERALQALDPQSDIASLEVAESAEVALLSVLRQAARAARLGAIAGERSTDPEAERAGALAIEHLDELARLLHDAASAVLRLAAAGRGEATAELEESVRKIRALASAHEELAALER